MDTWAQECMPLLQKRDAYVACEVCEGRGRVSDRQAGCSWRARYRQQISEHRHCLDKAATTRLARHAASCPPARRSRWIHRIKSYPDMTWGNNALGGDCLRPRATKDVRPASWEVVVGAIYWRRSATDGSGQIQLTAAWHSRHTAQAPAAVHVYLACLSVCLSVPSRRQWNRSLDAHVHFVGMLVSWWRLHRWQQRQSRELVIESHPRSTSNRSRSWNVLM